MAWVGTNSTNVQVTAVAGTTVPRSAHVLWAAKSALLEAGWRLMSYGTGTGGTYVPPNVDGATAVADGLTSPANFISKAAWFRVKEPGSTTAGRELVFQIGEQTYSHANGDGVLHIKYSRAGGFTLQGGGTVSATRSPTAPSGEGRVIFLPHFTARTDANVTTASAINAGSNVIATDIGGYVQAVASNTPDSNGVWPFYLWWYQGATSRDGGNAYQSWLFGIDSLMLGSHHPDDADPCCLLKVRLSDMAGTSSSGSTAMGPFNVSYWHGYGRVGAVWVHNGQIQLPGASYTGSGTVWNHLTEGLGSEIVSEAADTLTPYDGKVKMLPIGYAQAVTTGVTSSRWKGMSSNMMVFNTVEPALRVFNASSDNPRISLLASHTNSDNPMGLVVPWVPNKVPLG
jgi:hypothetical protein